MGRLSVAVLGAPESRYGGAALSFATRKALALLIYLAVEGGLHPREKIAALFWPESDEERARGSLRGTLAYLRDALRAVRDDEALLLIERDRLGIVASQLDLYEFEAAYTLARAATSASPAQVVAQLQAAASLYRGEFLEGFSLHDAPAFDDWASARREEWYRRAVIIFDRLSRELSDGGDVAGAREASARWVSVDPLNETAHRRLMQAHTAAGDRAAALRAYAACRAILAQELDAEPAPETEAVAALARVAVPAETASDRAPAMPAVGAEGDLVGRLSEHARLAAAYRAARRGRLQVVTIEGEPGIGKTRLANDFLGWATAQGATTLRGRAYETGGRLPYHALVEALRGQIAQENAPDDLLSDPWLAELGRLLPELYDRYPDLPAPLRLSDEAEARRRTFEAVIRYGQALAARAPVVFYIDDLHWADAGTLDLVPYACRRWAGEGAPLLLMAGLRSEEISTNPALAEWLAVLERDLPVTRLILGTLGLDDTRRLARSLLAGRSRPVLAAKEIRQDGAGGIEPGAPTSPPDEFSRWLFAETAGHPLFIVETMRSLLERDAVAVGAGGREQARAQDAGVVAAATPWAVVAPGVRAVIHARLARLGPAARRAIVAGAVLGDGCDFEQLYRVAGVEEEECLTGVDELLARRLLRESGGRYLFGHDKIREVAYAEAGEARRRVLHRRALDTLDATRAPAAALARHALAAGLVERAYGLSVAAGDEAMRLFAVRDAIGHYEQARALSRQPAGGIHGSARSAALEGNTAPERSTAPEQSHLYTQLGRAFELADQQGQAQAVYQAMLDSAQERGEMSIACAALNRLADVAAHQMDFGAQASLLRRALAAAEESGDETALVDTLWNLGQLSFFRAEFDAARAHHDRALALARALGLRELIARSLSWMAIAELTQCHCEEAYRHAEEAREISIALGNRVIEAQNLTQMAGARIRLGQPREGAATARAAYDISSAIEYHWGQAAATMELAPGLAEGGEYAEALDVAEAGVAAGRACGYLPLLALNLAQLGCVQRRLGAMDAAVAAHHEALAVAEMTHFPSFIELAHAELCADAAQRGDWTEAHNRARQALAYRSDALYGGLTRWCETEALLRAGEADAAEEDVRRFGARFGASRRYRIAYLRALAVLAGWRGETTQAIDHLREAATLADEIGLPGEAWEIAAALSALHQARGDEDQARHDGARAAEIVHELAARLTGDGTRSVFLAAEPVRRALTYGDVPR